MDTPLIQVCFKVRRVRFPVFVGLRSVRLREQSAIARRPPPTRTGPGSARETRVAVKRRDEAPVVAEQVALNANRTRETAI
jgi:hypothetical protein